MSRGRDFEKQMEDNSDMKLCMYRLTNVTHSEIAQCLPLPSLPSAFGAASPDIRLYDEEDTKPKRAADDSSLLAQADTIAELLRSTDVSYLSLKNKRNADSNGTASEPQGESGSLLQAVLRSAPDAFSNASFVRGNRRSTRSSVASHIDAHPVDSASEKPVASPSQRRALVSSRTTERYPPASEDSSSVLSPVSSRKTRMQRKETSRTKREDTVDEGTLLSGLCEMLDELFERTDVPGDDDGEGEGEDVSIYLSSADLKMVGEKITDLRAKNALNQLPIHHLVKLLNLLDRVVQGARDKDVEVEDDVDQENFSVVMSALEAVQLSLLIMTGSSMPKQVFKEEFINRIVEFMRYHIVHTVFTAYDPGYRQVHKRSTVDLNDINGVDDEDEYENGGHTAKRSRARDKGTKAKKGIAPRISGLISKVLHKLCSILGLLKDLLAVQSLLDSIVLQLTHTVLSTLAVDNIQLLQLKAIGVACMVFDLYPQHRTVVFDEIISLLWKLPSSKRNLRTFPLRDEDQSCHIQIFTAILLQLVQCSVSLPNVDQLAADAGQEAKTSEKPSATVKCFEPAMDSSNYFWRAVLQRWAAPKAQEGTDVKVVVENLVVDLLTTLNVPEFPASSLLLQILCLLLFGPVGVKAKDTTVRGNAIDLLGQIGARLQQDAVSCTNDKLWVLQEMNSAENVVEDRVSKMTCVVCCKSKSTQIIFSCDSCQRCFHGDCIGLTGHDLIGQRWLCHVCLCKRQIASLCSEVKSHVIGGPSLPRNKKVEDVDNPKEGTIVVQQILLNYLQEVSTTDGLAAYAHRFYLCQWYRDDAQGLENLQFYHRRAATKTPVLDVGMVHAPLARNAIVRIARSLGQQRPLARGYDRILQRLLASLQENASIPRAKALRAVSAMVEVYPDILGDERVQRAVEGRFLDSAISVREAAVELVGRHIVSRPDFAVKYFDKITERIMDTGVSVRKRVIKIIRDVCMTNAGFAKATDGCLRIISRINDEESSIQDLVGRTFYELWFEEPSGHSAQYETGGGVVSQAIAERTQQLVDVLRSLPNNQPLVTIIRRSLALDFCPQAVKNSAASTATQATVRHRCELMCKCLLESILKAEEGATEDSEVHALPHILALHAFCTVDPTFCAPGSDPSRYAVTLQPYLKTQVDNRDAAQLLQSIVFVIDTVLPLLRRPPESLVSELERDLRQLIVHYSFLTVVYACIKCLCSLSKVAAKGVTAFEFLVRRFFRLLDVWRKDQGGLAVEKSNVLRYLFCLGVLVRFGSDLIESMDDIEVNLQQILGLYKHYFLSEDFDVKTKALQAIGNVSIAKPEVLMEGEMGQILDTSLSSDSRPQVKMQMLRNFSDYLLDVEEKMGVSESASEAQEKREIGKAVPVAAGAGDSNICGGIIQLHWDQILGRCLDSHTQVRHASLKLVEIVLRQGLVHPMTCVPQLIALENDQYETNSKLAHRLLTQLIEKYPSFFESRLGDGLQLSFSFLQSDAASSHLHNSANGSDTSKQGLAKIAKKGISRVYKLIRGSRVSRNKFISSVIRKFELAASGDPISIPFLVFGAEILSALPFSQPDEPLYVVYSINRVVQVRGGVVEANMKASISDGMLGVVAKQVLGVMAEEKEQKGKEAYDVNATDDEESSAKAPVEDDRAGIPTEALEKLAMDGNAAMALALLLRLKRHLKILYNLNDARCQSFTPSETIKPGELLAKRETIKEFSTAELPTESATSVRQMLEQYQAFKRLLKEDAMDYSTYTANIPSRKRGRASVATAAQTPVANNHRSHFQDDEDGYQAPVSAKPITPQVTRILRKRSSTANYVDEPDSE